MSKKKLNYNTSSAFPLFKYLSKSFDQKDTHSIEKSLENNLWFSGEGWKLDRVRKLAKFSEYFLKVLHRNHITQQVSNISIGGSFFYKQNANDIDLNVIVQGSYFKYFESTDVSVLNEKLDTRIEKVSFMVFGEDNLFGGVQINDSVTKNGYTHTNLVMREGLVMPFRNATIYGKFITKLGLDQKNLEIRIARQVDHALKILSYESYADASTQKRLSKVKSRLEEALIYLDLIKKIDNIES